MVCAFRASRGKSTYELKLEIFVKKRKYQTVRVVITPLSRRYVVLSRLFCSQTGDQISNRATLLHRDAVWTWVFGSAANVQRFLEARRVQERLIRLSKLVYGNCDYAERGP